MGHGSQLVYGSAPLRSKVPRSRQAVRIALRRGGGIVVGGDAVDAVERPAVSTIMAPKEPPLFRTLAVASWIDLAKHRSAVTAVLMMRLSLLESRYPVAGPVVPDATVT
jgi:hypothetical protein